jgi:hypothetical protein
MLISSRNDFDIHMKSDGTLLSSTDLDPLGTLIYYLCVTSAIRRGGYKIPSSQKISRMLRIRKVKGKRKAIDPRIHHLWVDLLWMHGQKLLFDEEQANESRYFLPLSSTNVNKRIKGFRPGFKQEKPRVRKIEPKEFVDKTMTAARLIALKDLYHFNHRGVSQKLLFRFLRSQDLIDDEDELIHFLKTMDNIEYIEIDLSDPEKVQLDIRNDFFLEPGQVFRNQDMYLELRALDYFSEQGSDNDDRRLLRRELLKDAKDFATKNHKSKNVGSRSQS